MLPGFSMPETVSEKNRLRKQLHAARNAAHAADKASGNAAAREMTANFLGAIRDFGHEIGMGNDGCSIAAYAAIGSEISCDGLMVALDAAGYRLALPVVASEDKPLIFRHWRPGFALEAGDHATRQPDRDAGEVMPEVVVTPLLAFDRTGTRMGMGKGYYDRTLEGLRAKGTCLAIGLAFAAQEANHLPRDSFDQPLDWVVTEKEVIDCGRAK